MESKKTGTPLTLPQLRQAASVLARAFYDDPFFTFALPDGERRAQVLPWFYEKFLQYGMRYGKVTTTPSIEGAAIWLGPEKHQLTWLGIVQTGLFLLPVKSGWTGLQRSLSLSNYADRLHETAITGLHWYLCELGVEPSLQGQGVGSALIRPVLAQADRQALCCYLETNNEKNLPFYERNGFGVVKHGQVTPASPHTWAMLRKPAIFS